MAAGTGLPDQLLVVAEAEEREDSEAPPDAEQRDEAGSEAPADTKPDSKEEWEERGSEGPVDTKPGSREERDEAPWSAAPGPATRGPRWTGVARGPVGAAGRRAARRETACGACWPVTRSCARSGHRLGRREVASQASRLVSHRRPWSRGGEI